MELRDVWRRESLELGLAALALAGLFAAMFWREEVPRGPFSEGADVPPVPAASENGWILLEESSHRYAQRDLGPLGDDVQRLVDSDAPDVGAVARLGGELDALAVAPGMADELDAALARRRFVIACGLGPTDGCGTRGWTRANQIVFLLVLRDLRRGDVDVAARRSAALLRANHDALRSASSLLPRAAAIRSTREAVEAAALVALAAPPTESRDTTEAFALGDLDSALESMSEENWSMRTTLVGEAIRVRRIILGGPADWGTVHETFLDVGRMLRESDAYYQAAIRYAEDPSGTAAPMAPAWSSMFARARSEALHVVLTDVAPVIERDRDRAVVCRQRIQLARAAIAAR